METFSTRAAEIAWLPLTAHEPRGAHPPCTMVTAPANQTLPTPLLLWAFIGTSRREGISSFTTAHRVDICSAPVLSNNPMEPNLFRSTSFLLSRVNRVLTHNTSSCYYYSATMLLFQKWRKSFTQRVFPKLKMGHRSWILNLAKQSWMRSCHRRWRLTAYPYRSLRVENLSTSHCSFSCGSIVLFETNCSTTLVEISPSFFYSSRNLLLCLKEKRAQS